MAVSTEELFHVKGRLIRNPTDLTLAFPYGGKELGTFQEFRLRRLPRDEPLTEIDGEAVDALYQGTDVEVTGVLRNYDPDALLEAFKNSATSGAGGNTQLFEPGSALVPGQFLTDFSAVLLWAPFDVARPGLLVYNAVPRYRDGLDLRLSAFEDLALEEVRWLCLRDGSDRNYRLADFADLVANFP